MDLSPGMIALARAQEVRDPLGIDYAVGDGKSLSFDEPFDLIFAAYFLNYAHDAEELQTMCASLARCLKPGGRFLTVNCSPHAEVYSGRSFRRIRLGRHAWSSRCATARRSPGASFWRTARPSASRITFSIPPLKRPRCAPRVSERSSGRRRELSPEGLAAFGREYWADFLDHPPIAFLECVTTRDGGAGGRVEAAGARRGDAVSSCRSALVRPEHFFQRRPLRAATARRPSFLP